MTEKMIDHMIKGGIPKGEVVMFGAKSNVGKSRFPKPHKRTSSKLDDMTHDAVGIFIIGIIHVFIFFAKIAEWIWHLLPDKCEVEHCRRMGVRGNEQRMDGVVMCDYCAHLNMWDRKK